MDDLQLEADNSSMSQDPASDEDRANGGNQRRGDGAFF